MNTWISAKDIMAIVPYMSIRNARSLIKEIRSEMKNEGAYLFPAKELLAPKNRVLKKLEIEE